MCPHRVEQDVAGDFGELRIRLDQDGAEAAEEGVTLVAVPPVEPLRITTVELMGLVQSREVSRAAAISTALAAALQPNASSPASIDEPYAPTSNGDPERLKILARYAQLTPIAPGRNAREITFLARA
jgi:hypothetical protein